MGGRQSNPEAAPTNQPQPRAVINTADLYVGSRLPKFFIDAIIALYKEKGGAGGLSEDAFVSLFQGRTKCSEQLRNFLQALFRGYDDNKNNKMELEELLEMFDVVMYGDSNEKFLGMFKMCDTDRDGFIIRTELNNFMQTLSCIKDPDETLEDRKRVLQHLADAIFNKFDTDKDNVVTQVEFLEGCLKHDDMTREVEKVIQECMGLNFAE